MDLSLLTEDGNDTRFVAGICGHPLAPQRQAVLNNRGKWRNRILSVAPYAPVAAFDNNMGGNLYLTKAFGAPGTMYRADWQSTGAFCLTYWQWGDSVWAQRAVETVLLEADTALAASDPSNGYTVSGLSPSDVLVITKPPGLTYQAWSAWDELTDQPLPWQNRFAVTDDYGTTQHVTEQYSTPGEAEAAFGVVRVTGSTSYTISITDSVFTDNRGGLSVQVEREYFVTPQEGV